MQESNDDKNEISSNFDDLEFGINDGYIVAYSKTKSVASQITQSSSIAALICGVVKKCCVGFQDIEFSPLPNFSVGHDERHQKIFIRSEIRSENLNKGADLTEKGLIGFKVFAFPGDIPYQFFPKNIGGFDSGINCFPLNPAVDLESWNAAISKVYEHCNGGEENSARMIYVMVYAYENENFLRERPSQIFFNFKLYKNGKFVGEKIEGKIQNPKP